MGGIRLETKANESYRNRPTESSEKRGCVSVAAAPAGQARAHVAPALWRGPTQRHVARAAARSRTRARTHRFLPAPGRARSRVPISARARRQVLRDRARHRARREVLL